MLCPHCGESFTPTKAKARPVSTSPYAAGRVVPEWAAMLLWDETLDTCGTSLRGYLVSPYPFEETVARLYALTEQRPASVDMEKVSVEFVGQWQGAVFTLYDYKEDRELHIGGHSGLDVAGAQSAVLAALAAVTPRPYQAAEYYDACQGHRWPPMTVTITPAVLLIAVAVLLWLLILWLERR